MFKKENYLTKEQQLKNNFKKGLAIGLGCVCLTVGAYQFIVIPGVVKAEQARITTKKIDKKNEVQIWTLTKDIKQGENITNDILKTTILDKNKVPEDAIRTSEEIKDKVSKMDLKENTFLTGSMLLLNEDKLTTDLRKQDYEHIKLNVNLEKDMFIDIRFRKNDGTDFIVASKKRVLDRQDDVLITSITEKERQYINNATVLASLTEADMYTTIYVDAENQPPAKVTYEINDDVANMIKKDPNVVKAAEIEIKNRNSKSEENKEETTDNKKSDKEETTDNKKPVFVE